MTTQLSTIAMENISKTASTVYLPSVFAAALLISGARSEKPVAKVERSLSVGGVFEYQINPSVSTTNPTQPQETVTPNVVQSRHLTIEDFHWTREEALAVRSAFSTFLPDWDDPEMNLYDDYLDT